MTKLMLDRYIHSCCVWRETKPYKSKLLKIFYKDEGYILIFIYKLIHTRINCYSLLKRKYYVFANQLCLLKVILYMIFCIIYLFSL